MKRKIFIIFAVVILVSAMALSACTKEAEDVNDSIIVASIDDIEITRTEYMENWEAVKDNNSITDDILANEEYAEDLDNLRKSVLQSLVDQEVAKMELEALGYYELTEDEHETILSQTESTLDTLLSYYETEMTEELGDSYSEKDYVKAVNKYTALALEEYGIDEEYIEDYYTYELVLEKAEGDLLDLTVTDEYVEEYFNQLVEEDKEFYTDLSLYEYYTESLGYISYYVPEGFRMVRHVLIAFDDDTITAIQELRDAADDEGADALVEESLEAIYEEATEVLTLLEDGTITFDEAIETYNDDSGMDSYPEGYQICENSMLYVEEFTNAGMALENIGEISGLVATDYGYHILEYYSDVEAGPIDFETVKDDLAEDAVSVKQEEEWVALLDEWYLNHEIVYYYENIAETLDEEEATEDVEDTTEDAG